MQFYRVQPQSFVRFSPIVRYIGFKKNTCYARKARLIDPEKEDIIIPTKCYNPPKVGDGPITFPIVDQSRAARKRRERELWHNKVKSLGTVEEKIFELNMPKYYGWKFYKLEEGNYPYDPLPKIQHMTRTHIVSDTSLPAYYDDILSVEAIDSLVQQIKDPIEEVLINEFKHRKRDYEYKHNRIRNRRLQEDIRSKAVTEQINRILTLHLAQKYPHLLEADIDLDPRIEAFWFFGGFETPREVITAREGREWTKEFKNDPIDQQLQYYGNPIFQLRHKDPLKQLMPIEDSENTNLEVPVENLDPRKTGYFPDRKHGTVIPGFWPGDTSEFGLVSYHYRSHLLDRHEWYADHADALKAQAILASFGWLYGQACYQGFSTFQDPTYPFVNQSVITNAQEWSFSTYQLNTTSMHIDAINENPKRNVCWITEPLKLFDCIEDSKVQGLNVEVLKNLIKFYVNKPEPKEGIEMKPYLSKEKFIADISDQERRNWLEKNYKHLLSNRPRHRLAPEIYHWQKIYMIDNKTRPLEKRRDWWQFGIQAYDRRLDEHTHEYIPKKLRDYPKSKKKWANTYYPSVPWKQMIDPYDFPAIDDPSCHSSSRS